MKSENMTVPPAGPVPMGQIQNLLKWVRYDLVAGLLVFLIALPLCLAISLASGYPAVAGVLTAIVGGVCGALISNSELTIKGPAAGLIVIAVGCVTEFGFTGGQDPTADMAAYRMALGVGVAAAVVQVVLAAIRVGVLGEFFPSSVVHGMMAAIGVIIISKQLPVVVGGSAKGEPLELLAALPGTLWHSNPEISFIGAVSLAILFGKPLIHNKWVAMIPSQLLVLLVAVPMGMWFNLSHDHTYTFLGAEHEVGGRHLVNVPFNFLSALVTPDFSGLWMPKAWKWVVMYAVIGSIESLLSTQAIELLDPWKRKTNLDRDLLAVAVGNLCASAIGGLPMISEIVRSKANIDSGARTRFANLYHGLFLLVAVALFAPYIHEIPMAALAAMLVYTGTRLAHPKEFRHAWNVGPEQFIIYVVTMVSILATDLLVGIAIGVAVKIVLHICLGLPPWTIFRSFAEVLEEDGYDRIVASHSAVFTNWIPLRREIVRTGIARKRNVVIDFTNTKIIDHTTLTKLNELSKEFADAGLWLEIEGMDEHTPLSTHPHATRHKLPAMQAADGPSR